MANADVEHAAELCQPYQMNGKHRMFLFVLGHTAGGRWAANGKMGRDLAYRLRYPSYCEGLRAWMENGR